MRKFPEKEFIALKVMDFRKERSLTQEQFAELVGVDAYTVIRWEKMEHKPNWICYREMVKMGVFPKD